MSDLVIYLTPDEVEYSRLKPYERARARHLIGLNARLMAEQAQTLEDSIVHVQTSREQEIARAKSEARQAARDEIARIYADEYQRERVRAFEAHRVATLPHGDLDACASESAAYDKRQRNP